MDLEGLARVLPRDKALAEIVRALELYKGKRETNYVLAQAIVQEVENSRRAEEFGLMRVERVGARAGESGLGSRGMGDHIIHSYLLKMTGGEFEDAGIADDIVVSIDGIHSRLSYFPFFAGFHASKAAVRDIVVKGARPLGMLVDVHLADDADISYLFDFEAGVAAVAKTLGIRVLAGSTLRIGGDMVIGERISGGVGAIGRLVSKSLLRAKAKKGEYLVMTEGRGGGTITATAIFNGMPEVALKTVALDEVVAALRIIASPALSEISMMTDVTNGGIRADAVEISKSTGLSVVLDVDKFVGLIDADVRAMLEKLQIDPLGLSIDSILIATNEPDRVIQVLRGSGVRADVVGTLEEWKGYPIVDLSGRKLEYPFRESPYTPVKKVIGNSTPFTLEELEERVRRAYEASMKKVDEVVKTLKVRYSL